MTPWKQARRVGLALGGGGARGFAHIGVLRALEERDIALDAVTGCSTAALIAAFIAAGYRAEEMHELLERTSFLELLHVHPTRGLSDQVKLGAWLERHLPARFEDLELPLGVVAVDLQRGELVRFSSGPLIRPLLASHAFPGLFHPIELDGRVLVDGGILDQVPVGLLRELTDAPMIAVEAHVARDQEVELDPPPGPLARLVGLLRGRVPAPVQMTFKANVITRAALAERHYRDHPPDLILRPPLGTRVAVYDFDKVREALEIGYQEAREALEGEEVVAAG